MKHIPMLNLHLEYLYMKSDIDAAIQRCLEHQQWILGPEVKMLEDKVAEYLKVKHCIGVSSGTDAIVLSLRALAIKNGQGREYFDRTDKIITTPFTFTATAEAILRAGATPVFVDIDPVTYNINPVKIREYLRFHASGVVGIVPVHLYGQACNMDEIMSIANEYNLFVVEDVAQAFGGMWKGSAVSPRKLGSFGIAGCFSFFPSKNLGGFGDGGMVSTNDDEIADLVRILLKHGGKEKYRAEYVGYNARLDTLQSSVLLAKLKYVDEFNERRKKVAEIYNKELAEVKEINLPFANSYHVFHQYTITVLNGRRDALRKYLEEKGISTMIYYPTPLHRMKIFNQSKSSPDCINAQIASESVLSLPIEPLFEQDDVYYVAKNIGEFFQLPSSHGEKKISQI